MTKCKKCEKDYSVDKMIEMDNVSAGIFLGDDEEDVLICRDCYQTMYYSLCIRCQKKGNPDQFHAIDYPDAEDITGLCGGTDDWTQHLVCDNCFADYKPDRFRTWAGNMATCDGCFDMCVTPEQLKLSLQANIVGPPEYKDFVDDYAPGLAYPTYELSPDESYVYCEECFSCYFAKPIQVENVERDEKRETDEFKYS